MNNINKIHISMPDWLLKRRTNLLYMVLIPGEFKDFDDMAPEGEFSDMVTKYLQDYLLKDKMPPAEIAPAILNLVDDQLAGRELTIRSGDYISLQNYLKANK